MTNQKFSISIFTLSVLALIACENSSRQNITDKQVISVDSVSSNIADDVKAKVYDYSTFPIDSFFSTKVLRTGIFHSDEVWKNADKEKWFGIFKNKTGFYIAETKLKTKRVYDVIVDENEDEKTGWEVQTVNADTSIILIQRINSITPRHVEQAILSKDQIIPGDSILINYLGIHYKIFATGIKKKIQADQELYDISNYKLFIQATIKGHHQKSLLVAHPDFDDQMIKLIFGGDIDGDGILDLIIDTSRHYNVTSPTIYLSRPAENVEVVKPIGGHSSVGC